jgi:hypothetical protein
MALEVVMGKTAKAKKAKKAKGLGRPRIEIAPELLNKLAEVGCSQAEIASMLRRSGVAVDKKTIQRRLAETDYRDQWEDGVNALRVKLRSRMVAQAMMMNGPGVHQAQYLSKQYLGMSEKIEHSGKIDSHVEVESARDSLTRKLDSLAKRLGGGTAGATEAGDPPPLPHKSVRNGGGKS